MGTSWTLDPDPSASLIRMRKIAISPARAFSGGLTNIVTVVDSFGLTTVPLSGYVMFHPAPALLKYGARGALPNC